MQEGEGITARKEYITTSSVTFSTRRPMMGKSFSDMGNTGRLTQAGFGIAHEAEIAKAGLLDAYFWIQCS